MAWPMPRPPPVMSATLPLSRFESAIVCLLTD